ncbi:MAG: hypothetical protein WBF08_05025 [Candidatus Bathyarchaeia archaeon]
MKHRTLFITNTTIWAIAIISVAILLFDTSYFYSILLTLCIGCIISIILTAGDIKTKKKEWYEGS